MTLLATHIRRRVWLWMQRLGFSGQHDSSDSGCRSVQSIIGVVRAALQRLQLSPERGITGEGDRLTTTIAFLAECQGSATIEKQKASLAVDDQVVIAGRASLGKLAELLARHGIKLGRGDRIKVYDLTCISVSTTILVRTLTKLLRDGIAFEIITAGIVIEPAGDDKLHALLDVLDGHYRHVHGIKTHPIDTAPQGRKRLLDPDQLTAIRARLERPGATATGVAQELGVARSTLFNYLDRYDRERRLDRSK